MIGLLGATGYTGRLVGAELARRGIPHRLGARSPERLAALPHSDVAEPFAVDVGERARLDSFMAGLDGVISTVGPFARLGMPAVDAAARNGIAYVDSTGEQDFITEVYARFADAPAPVVPSAAFNFLPGDLAAAIAIADLGSNPTEVAVHVEALGVPTRGTARTAVEMTGALSPEGGVRRVPFPDGVRLGIEVPFFCDAPLRRHAGDARIVTTMVLPRVAVPVMKGLSRVLPRLAPLVERLPDGPPARLRSRARSRVLAEAIGPTGRTAVVCEGLDTYGLSARFLVEAVQQVRGRGAMAPAEALDAEAFLTTVSGDDVNGSFSWQRL